VKVLHVLEVHMNYNTWNGTLVKQKNLFYIHFSAQVEHEIPKHIIMSKGLLPCLPSSSFSFGNFETSVPIC